MMGNEISSEHRSSIGFTVFINLSTQLVEPGKDCDYKEHGDAMISQDC
jgi:hypothetical protein